MTMERGQYYLYSLHVCSKWSIDQTQVQALNIEILFTTLTPKTPWYQLHCSMQRL